MKSFSKVKKVYRLRKKAGKIKKVLKKISATVEGREAKIVMRGDQRVEEIWLEGKRRKDLEKLFNKALKKVQKKAARQVDIGDLGL